jgi:hypothetical protein
LTQIGARYYDPALGKFVSVDPVLDATDPQQWAPYSYSNSNPVTWSDPSGEMYLDGQGGSSRSSGSSSSGVGSLSRAIGGIVGWVVSVVTKVATIVKTYASGGGSSYGSSSSRARQAAAAQSKLRAQAKAKSEQRSFMGELWKQVNPGTGIAAWMTTLEKWDEFRGKDLNGALGAYQGGKGPVRADALKKLEDAGYGKGTNRLNAAKTDAARSLKVAKWMARGGGALGFTLGMLDQFGESKKSESSGVQIGLEMAITGGLAFGFGAAGATLGLLCGPGAPACSTGLAIAGGAAGGYAGTEIGKWVNKTWW